ncbi:MAG: hypothetical protein WBQ86_10630 [Candidatus Binatus sp.]
MTNGESEHDEVVYPSGDVADIYPDKATPHEVIFHKANGGKLDVICLNEKCSNMHLSISGSQVFADGAYELLQSDDPQLMMVRDGSGERTLGYLAKNHGGSSKFFPDLQEAQEYEHKGDTARTVGKVVGGTLLVAAIVVLAGAAAAADAQANTVTTRCHTWGSNTTCTSY